MHPSTLAPRTREQTSAIKSLCFLLTGSNKLVFRQICQDSTIIMAWSFPGHLRVNTGAPQCAPGHPRGFPVCPTNLPGSPRAPLGARDHLQWCFSDYPRSSPVWPRCFAGSTSVLWGTQEYTQSSSISHSAPKKPPSIFSSAWELSSRYALWETESEDNSVIEKQ